MKKNNKNTNNHFLSSALDSENSKNKLEDLVAWIEERNDAVSVDITEIKLADIQGWNLDSDILRHNSNKFFSIEGLKVKTNWGQIPYWEQPIINQPEIGFLGFITKSLNGVLHFLVQAKIEPGNVNNVQISPTLQATKSNYTQVHGGLKPRYLEYFQDRINNEVLLDQLQSEQGARFIKKRNRNIIIRVDTEIKEHEDFKWVTLNQIKKLMELDNVVNMDTRTVLSGIPYGSFDNEVIQFYNLISNSSKSYKKMLESEISADNYLFSIDKIISWFTELKSFYELEIHKISLSKLSNWTIGEYAIVHDELKYFSVIGVDVTIGNREITNWQQPLIKPAQRGLCAFIVKEINDTYHFLVQAKLECGNFDILEMAPTVQCLTGNYQNESSRSNLPYLKYVLSVSNDQKIFDTYQSEEGGRFYKEENRNIVILAGEEIDLQTPPNFIWMTLNQIKSFIKYNNYFNIQARSLIAAIKYK